MNHKWTDGQLTDLKTLSKMLGESRVGIADLLLYVNLVDNEEAETPGELAEFIVTCAEDDFGYMTNVLQANWTISGE